MQKQRLRHRNVKSVWGTVKMPLQDNLCVSCNKYHSSYTETNMDSSGFLPNALEKGIDLATRMGFEEAALVANKWGLPISSSGLGRIVGTYGAIAYEEGKKAYKKLANQPLESIRGTKTQARRWIIQTDGTIVLERGKGKKGRLEGREVKSVVAYPLETPSERVSVSAAIPIGEFRPLAHGLLRQAGIKQEDICLGLGDGAIWVVDLLTELGCEQVLLDVYHATNYLEKVLKKLGFCEQEREKERKAWLRGDVDGKEWLSKIKRQYSITEEGFKSWAKEERQAWEYLKKSAEREGMAYPEYKEEGWDIGSGQIEGYNKWAIGKRMKCSGMHWGKEGLERMAFLRSEFASAKPITNFHFIRLKAFPALSLPLSQ